jgi:hypothetical protein
MVYHGPIVRFCAGAIALPDNSARSEGSGNSVSMMTHTPVRRHLGHPGEATADFSTLGPSLSILRLKRHPSSHREK